MYKISWHASMSKLIGAELIQVCVGKNEVALNLSDDCSISIFSKIVIGSEKSSIELYENPIEQGVKLLSFLGTRIKVFDVSEGNRIDISFDFHRTLSILDNSTKYESCVIRIQGDDFIM